MLWTAAAVRAHSDDLFTHLTEEWKKLGGDVPPLGFIYYTFEGQTLCSIVPEVANLPKDAVPSLMRVLAEENEASFVGIGGSAFVVAGLTSEEASAWFESGRSLSEHPNALDSLMLTVDGAGLSLVYRAWKDAAGEMQREVTEGHEYEGRFANLSGRMGEN
jgi:hypothetical protein